MWHSLSHSRLALLQFHLTIFEQVGEYLEPLGFTAGTGVTFADVVDSIPDDWTDKEHIENMMNAWAATGEALESLTYVFAAAENDEGGPNA